MIYYRMQQNQSEQRQSTNVTRQLRDPRRINCQICTNVLTLQQNVGNLYNNQQEKNNEILCQYSD